MTRDEIYEWLEREAKKRRIHALFHKELARQDNGFLSIPVYIQDVLDAYDKASRLQELEDAWNNQEPEPSYQLLLVPAAN